VTSNLPKNLYIGTDSFSWDEWVGVFYPQGTKQADYIAEYAKRYSTVEIDSTFYRIPSKSTVTKWDEKTPKGFVFAAKIPRVITHVKFLEDCEGELNAFLKNMGLLGEKLGPLLFQFRYYRKSELKSVDEFTAKLEPFLATLPKEYSFVVEVRNREWIGEKLLDVLRRHGVALALVDHPWMDKIEVLMQRLNVLTADFCYVRWLGDRNKIEKQTKRWDKIVVDRTQEMKEWIPVIKRLLKSDITALYGYFSNHYAGHAPGSVDFFGEMWKKSSRIT
jgi:uncharacterized protein YecE (DUF72 family)